MRTRRLLAAGLLVCCGGCNLPGSTTTRPANNGPLQRGEQALVAKNYAVALVEFREAVRLNPQLAEAHTKLGLAYKESGQLEDAAGSLENALRLDARDFSAAFNLGEVYRLLNRVAQALRAYALAVRISPDDFDARFRLAAAYHESGEHEKALAEYEAAVKLNPKDAHAWSNLGALQDTIGQPYKAITAYRKSLECNQDQPVVLVNLATVYLNQERFATARKTLEAAVRQGAGLSIAWERLGYCNWREQRLDEALENYRKAVSLSDTNARAYAGLGVVRMTQYLGDAAKVAFRDEAIEAWHRSLELDPSQTKLRDLIEKYRVKSQSPMISTE